MSIESRLARLEDHPQVQGPTNTKRLLEQLEHGERTIQDCTDDELLAIINLSGHSSVTRLSDEELEALIEAEESKLRAETVR